MKKRVNALCIVAHPDDDLIWMGGTILKNPEWSWTVFSLCRANDKDRAPKFKKVCKFYGARAIISDLDDEVLSPLDISEVISKIKENLPKEKYDYVFTHGENGEYGHIRHREIHKAVKKMTDSGEIKCRRLLFFSYVPGKETAPHDSDLRIPVANKNADWVIELDDAEHKKKMEIITKVYGFKENIFETLSSKKEEAFLVARR